MFLVEARGIEPLFWEPKSHVLPLYDASKESIQKLEKEQTTKSAMSNVNPDNCI